MNEWVAKAAMLILKCREDDMDVIVSVERPGRHHHIIHTLARQGMDIPIGSKERGHIQGFVTSEGNFVDREQAYRLAKQNGQLPEDFRRSSGILYSEDLW